MFFPIINSMLRGDLRRNILSTLKTEKEISLLWNPLAIASKGTATLMEVEKALEAAVEKSGLVNVSSGYRQERNLRLGAQKTRDLGLSEDNDNYTRVNSPINLEGVFGNLPEETPTDRFLYLLARMECRRVVISLKELVIAVHNDAVVRTEVRKAFAAISSLCKDSNDEHLQIILTQCYFEVYHTFRRVLEKGDNQSYETDFKNFIYEWKGRFPDEEMVKKYENIVDGYSPLNRTIHKNEVQAEPAPSHQEEPPKAKDKFDRFLDAAEQFHFSQMPKVKGLGTKEKIRQLLECLLEDKGSIFDTFGHTAAMLEFLGLYQWITAKQISGFTLKQYDEWCTRNIMEKAKGAAFKHYRLSVNVDPAHTRNASYKYMGWKYKDLVEEEYYQILNA
jgi:hypothetical protein